MNSKTKSIHEAIIHLTCPCQIFPPVRCKNNSCTALVYVFATRKSNGFSSARISCNSVPKLRWLVAPDSMINVRDPESNVADDVQQFGQTRSAIAITSSQNQFQEVAQSVVMLACGDCWPTFTSSRVYFQHTLRDSEATFLDL